MGGVWQPQGSSPHPCRRHGAPRAPDACRPRPLASGSSAASKTRKAPNHAHRRLQLQGNHPRHHSNWPQRLEARDPGNHHEAHPVSALIRQPETMARARSRVTVLLCVQSSKAEVREPSAAYPQKVGPIQTATPGPHELDTITRSRYAPDTEGTNTPPTRYEHGAEGTNAAPPRYEVDVEGTNAMLRIRSRYRERVIGGGIRTSVGAKAPAWARVRTLCVQSARSRYAPDTEGTNTPGGRYEVDTEGTNPAPPRYEHGPEGTNPA